MKGKIKLHLMMLVSIMLCNTSSMVLAAGKEIAAAEEISILQEIIYLAKPLPEGKAVEIFPSDEAMCEPANLRSKRFEWLGQINRGIADEEPLDRLERAGDVNAIRVVYQAG